MHKFKIILAGDKNVGKSSLIIRFCNNTFYEYLKETIGVGFKRKKVVIQYEKNEIALDLNIWDFGGEEKFRTLFPSYASAAAAALILFDTTNKKTLYEIGNWIRIIEDNALDNVVKVIVATKIDLKDKREIENEEITNYFAKYSWCKEIIETSSKTGENVEKAFLSVGKELIEKNLQKCRVCGEYFSKKLNYCQHCREKIEMELI